MVHTRRLQNLNALVSITGLLLAALPLPAPAQTQAQAWDYVSYKKDPTSGRYLKDLGNAGALELMESDGKATFRIIAGALDACHRGSIPATVERTAQTTTITMVQAISGCPMFRYVIRNDGSGGRKEIQRGSGWVDDQFDHGLVPRK